MKNRSLAAALQPPEERCEKSELFPSACAHCRGLALDPVLEDLGEVHVSRWYRAVKRGICPRCGHEYFAGDRLALFTGEGRVCERCAS